MKIAVLDTYYPDFLKSVEIGDDGYETLLQRLLAKQFGTADFYSRNLRALGWEAIDIIANCYLIQQHWAMENNEPSRELEDIALAQIKAFAPDVVFVQDLSFFSVSTLHRLRGSYLLVAQHSCPWAGDERVREFHLIFTSFPHYVPRIEALGVRAVYNPLAFEFEAIRKLVSKQWERRYTGYPDALKRIHDCVFIGGVGNPSHWTYGMQVLETVAREIPTFKWWGYGVETLPADSLLRQKYQGQAFGIDMYSILLQSKIALCRHGEVAEGYTNAMRVFESTGCGALMLTEESKNIWDLFSANEIATYLTPVQAVQKIQYYLANEGERAYIAAKGQARCLRDHTYTQRMQVVSEVLRECLVSAIQN